MKLITIDEALNINPEAVSEVFSMVSKPTQKVDNVEVPIVGDQKYRLRFKLNNGSEYFYGEIVNSQEEVDKIKEKFTRLLNV